jgi:hypothetical protein
VLVVALLIPGQGHLDRVGQGCSRCSEGRFELGGVEHEWGIELVSQFDEFADRGVEEAEGADSELGERANADWVLQFAGDEFE